MHKTFTVIVLEISFISFLNLLFIILNYMDVYVYICVPECIGQGYWMTWAGVTGGGELPVVGAGN